MISRSAIGASIVFGLLAIATSCQTLPALTPSCGNKVIDPGEDCDSFGDPKIPGSTCIAAGQPGACHYACDESACPATYTCGGATHVCRQPSGKFKASVAVAGESARRVLSGDFDGDGAADVVTVGTTSRIRFFDGRSAGPQLALSSESSLPALGDLTADGRTSGVVVSTFVATGGSGAIEGNLRVWRGSADRTLLPTVYPNIDLTAQGLTGGRAISAFRANQLGTDVFALLTSSAGSALYYVVGAGLPTGKPLYSNLGSPSAIQGEIPVSTLGSGCLLQTPFTSCQSMVLAFTGASSVGIYPSCNAQLAVNDGTVAPLTFTLPSDVVAGPAFLIRPPSGGAPSLYVVGNQGVWAFPGNACSIATTGVLVPGLPAPSTSRILALGYIDDSQVAPFYLDWVDVDGIHVKYGPLDTDVTFTPAPSNDADAGTAWFDARIDDLNLNGLPDVVAISPSSLDFYNGTGSVLLNPKHIALDGTATHLATGDYDGDFVTDFVVTTHNDSTGLVTDDIGIAFGQFTGFPSAPTSVGRLGSITQVEPALFDYRLTGSADFITTLFAVGTAPDNHIAVSILEGDPDRLINSPFFLDPSTRSSLVSAVVGDFTGSGHAGLAGMALQAGKPPTTGLWFAAATGAAQIDVSTSSVSPALPNVTMRPDASTRDALAAIDVGGPAGKELLLVQPAQKNIGFGGLFLLTNVQGWQVLANEPLTDATMLADKGGVVVRTADLDGNGFDDVIVEYGDATNNDAFAAKIILNQGNGTLSFASAITPALPPDTIALTTIHAKPDGTTQLVALARGGVYLASFTNGAVGSFDRAIDFAGFTDGGATTVRDCVAADVDGDGVEDLVIGTSTGFLVYFGDAEDP